MPVPFAETSEDEMNGILQVVSIGAQNLPNPTSFCGVSIPDAHDPDTRDLGTEYHLYPSTHSPPTSRPPLLFSLSYPQRRIPLWSRPQCFVGDL